MMKNELKTFLKPTLRRVIVILSITLLLSAFLYWGQRDRFNARNVLCTGIIITAIAGAWNIYDLNSLSLIKRSLIHFLLMVITILPTLLLSGWFPIKTFGDIVLMIAIFLCSGLLCWTIGYLAFRNKK
ncbi:DUF3021 family protein [Streptococcus mutans]|uniref:DUF3021 family protein n=1 Tax=Streptococcus mutans TaxID=1309 RepID=A0AAX1K502_STRMG|nr:DUF3021 family protein [Streptococcus mutans]EMB53321.1 hypothetical protein SMU3_06157 [Streptococcus mutans 11A1]EMB57737.1 hypothetical protein SMU88_00175 [Streptococcus mutans NLML8]EMB69986.1 hypothetical protein SMU33_07030 [Streptococcus mutans 11SSST2]EMB84104.1 hypothetical protein SMU54_07697 [Streptococcus mutans A9]EMC02409.1 hypothetical protein SMU68_06981 [Streptococcus mutans NFSM1]